MVEHSSQLNSIGSSGILGPNQGQKQSPKIGSENSADFKNLLMESIREVNNLQTEAEKATTDMVTGKSDNVAEVFTAVKKAEIAFQALTKIRSTLMDAYNEIKQMRV